MRIPRTLPPPGALALAALAACGGGPKVVVHAALDGQPVADLPVRLLPYDREAVLDSLAGERGDTIPEVPQELLQRLSALQAREAQLRQRGDTVPAAVRAERQALLARADSLRKARAAWLEKIREPYEEAVEKAAAAAGTGEKADTTDAAGRAELEAGELAKGWLVATYVLPETVLEWEVPVTLRGDSTVVRLTRRNAREEPLLP
ncbi:MAG TPA: hypothetical protein VF746_12005 [Longimicrobium sp.]